MPWIRSALLTAATTVLLAGVAACDAPESGEVAGGEPEAVHGAGDDLGVVAFQVSCDPVVQGDFDRAVALLHHMMYQEARATFQAIAQEDPECAMAHWGIAMSLFQPLWPGRPDVDTRRQGWEAVERARALGPGTEREDLLLGAAEAFWANPDEDDWWGRVNRWAAALEEAHRERPEDVEVAAFRGLAVLAAGQVAEDQLAENARAADILQAVHEREPRHPGAIHYTIHADDVTGRAHQNLHVVEAYGEVAPHVPHALHMPSHIYVRLGEWPEVIEWNRRSAEAALEHPAGDRVSFHHIHALDYKLYGFLQRGDDRQARDVLERALATGPYQEDFAAAFHLAIMPARYALERRDWAAAAALEPGSPDYLAWDRYDWPRAISWFARGMGSVMTGDLDGAGQAEARLLELRDRAQAAGEAAFTTYIEVDRLILSGRLAWAEGEEEEAVARTREAAELEGTVQKHPITPGALLPPFEALGDLLFDLDRPAEALGAYEEGLEIWPQRYRSLLGAARAAEASGQESRAREHLAALLEVVDPASDRPGVEAARAQRER